MDLGCSDRGRLGYVALLCSALHSFFVSVSLSLSLSLHICICIFGVVWTDLMSCGVVIHLREQ